jgi:hypothetical protein
MSQNGTAPAREGLGFARALREIPFAEGRFASKPALASFMLTDFPERNEEK